MNNNTDYSVIVNPLKYLAMEELEYCAFIFTVLIMKTSIRLQYDVVFHSIRVNIF